MPEPTTLQKFIKVILVFYLVLGALVCFMRAEFIDVFFYQIKINLK